MARLNDLAQGRLDAPKLHPNDISIKAGWNYREVDSEAVQRHIAWLKQSIRNNGIQKPVEVEFTDGVAYLVDGECRLRAAKELLKEGLLVLIPTMQAKGDEPTIRAKSMIANGSLPPTMLEFGKAAAQLLAWGWSEDDVAKYVPPHIGLTMAKAKRYVKDAVDLHHAPLEVKKAVSEGVDGVKVSPAAALAASRGNRLQAGEILKDKAQKAKAAGKTEVKRPKHDGKVAKAKAERELKLDDLHKLGDQMAELILAENADWDKLERLAKRWQKARG